MEYDFRAIETKWQQYWRENGTFKADHNSDKPKYYVLDMFPYPSGSGLHVGHPLGYIASDIYARYKRLKGFNVLHPMGYDAFGLPAEQHAIATGQHPAVSTNKNLERYREQLDLIGFSFDWDREVRTNDPSYYKWTQWIFMQLFDSWYNNKSNKAEPIGSLVDAFGREGNGLVDANCSETAPFTAEEWNAKSEKEQQTILLNYRLAYLSETMVNWCPELGTVLANEEVKDGLSERGGHPVVRKEMKQWSLRITAYAQRLLDGLDGIDWTDSLKEMQRNWIGRSQGASLFFQVKDSDHNIEVFTTRPDTIFGATFMVLAPENPMVADLTTAEHREAVEAYVEEAANRSERDRMADVKRITGAFTGSYALHPFTNESVPVWIGDYVLAGYGTGAVMAVPAGDQRDWDFATHFGLPIIPVIEGQDVSEKAEDRKDGKMINSDFLNGLEVPEAIKAAVARMEEKGLGNGQVNYRLRDAIFSRQRYWGEPIPVYYKDEMPYMLEESELPLELPEVDKYLPTEDGDPPLRRARNWVNKDGYPLETNTMPGWAGSSWYYLRYLDANNSDRFASEEAVNYWKQVDLYMGGAEHATGHLLYVRFWTKFLHDLGHLPFDEPAKKLINQGMIQGVSALVYRVKETNTFICKNRIGSELTPDEQKLAGMEVVDQDSVTELHAEVSLFTNESMDIEGFKAWRAEFAGASFIMGKGEIICGTRVEKMSKRWYNAVVPDDLVTRYGADALRLHEMFLGPIEMHKPWNTKGIEGVSKFLKKLWRLYHDSNYEVSISEEEPNKAEYKSLHKLIQKVQDDNERFSFNTSVSSFMVCVNELTELKCNKRAILDQLPLLIGPHAPHIAEELWRLLGHTESMTHASFPVFNPEYLVEDSFAYPVSFNGKMRFKMEVSASASKEEVEQLVLEAEESQKWLEGKEPRKVIVVPKRIVNIVL